MKKKYIYVITALKFGYKYGNQRRSGDGKYHSFECRTSKSQKKYFTIIRQRTWGWYSSLKDAQWNIAHNGSWFLEDLYYPHLVIERFEEGICCYTPKEWWYQWDGDEDTGKYVPWKKPEEFEHTIGFGMG